MEPIHEEFHESELFPEVAREANSEDIEDEESPTAEQGEEQPDDYGLSSAKSSLTITALDTGAELPHQAADGPDDQQPGFRPIAASMPASSSHIRMGSSVPVSIPHMNRWKKPEAQPDSPTAQYAPATFVPPHQLSQVNEFMFSFTGESPSVAIKRDRLRVRNAILKSTGFLEPGVEQVNNIGLQERNRLAVAAGGLSQALQQHGTVLGSIAAAVKTSS
ncbi:hypothetical protein VOLCADRAFT_89698 [Volvox carteri f. nagariensis]|uniref:Uncharacterized protein n=1 Tax=Volvox carteri f. nagariensis TaxID=3068 RepID=D8TRU9_VOLCA|nr:uncharacterized protein VOLCADRAFT_89698 [Volvox carteri f. nagariensis]EFJ49831.1 hypothetical protein VOLCADRAFT_89698 [Volvox carteri f. nagariensis]|eukprot:XP_002949338.1 hypothetical protein VOLCADRAFT_89698 [Volvox carteri f. nagariensis]